jgi:hypothetical protein
MSPGYAALTTVAAAANERRESFMLAAGKTTSDLTDAGTDKLPASFRSRDAGTRSSPASGKQEDDQSI